MYRTHSCGELRIEHSNQTVTLAGWIQRIRNKGKMIWIDLRDRYGITQLVFEEDKTNAEVFETAKHLGREFVIQVSGTVIERYAKNPELPTGDIELFCEKLLILNKSETPPFTIENDSDGGDDLRAKYRYLDLRRPIMQERMALRYKTAKAIRTFLDKHDFFEIETPYLIKSTPEGARDFVVPSRLHAGEFYALPQSPQTFKQLLMIGGYDRYFQLVKCFRDEDFRADRQPEFTQIDCEMAFVEQEDILSLFEDMMRYVIKEIKGIELSDFPRITYDEAITKYGSDKPDLRFDLPINEFTKDLKGHDFKVFDEAEYIGGFIVKGNAETTSRKVLDSFTNYVKTPQVGGKGMVYVKYNTDHTVKSSIDKFYSQDFWHSFAQNHGIEDNDLVLIMSGNRQDTLTALGRFRLHLANHFEMIDANAMAPLWVIDFPLLEWDEEAKRYNAMHHPFTAPKPEDLHKLDTNPGDIKANAYDMVLNGNEIGGGSIRIHDAETQRKMFRTLNLTDDEIDEKFGFIVNAFKYGAPPHGGIAFGFDRIVTILAGSNSIRDVIAFPKNNAGRDVMLDSPSAVSKEQLEELHIKIEESDE